MVLKILFWLMNDKEGSLPCHVNDYLVVKWWDGAYQVWVGSSPPNILSEQGTDSHVDSGHANSPRHEFQKVKPVPEIPLVSFNYPNEHSSYKLPNSLGNYLYLYILPWSKLCPQLPILMENIHF